MSAAHRAERAAAAAEAEVEPAWRRSPPAAAAAAIAAAFERGVERAVLVGPEPAPRRAALRRLARRSGGAASTLLLRVAGEGPDNPLHALAEALKTGDLDPDATGAIGSAVRARLAALAEAGGGAPLLLLDDADRASLDELRTLAAETRDPVSGRRMLRLGFAIDGSEAGAAAAAAALDPEPVDLWARLPVRMSRPRDEAPGGRRPFTDPTARRPASRGEARRERLRAMLAIGAAAAVVGAMATRWF